MYNFTYNGNLMMQCDKWDLPKKQPATSLTAVILLLPLILYVKRMKGIHARLETLMKIESTFSEDVYQVQRDFTRKWDENFENRSYFL
jgi:hypothetical protein